MKLSNLRRMRTIDFEGEACFVAEVDCTTGLFFWKRTATRRIFKSAYCSATWYFSDTGKFIDLAETNRLIRVWKAAHAE